MAVYLSATAKSCKEDSGKGAGAAGAELCGWNGSRNRGSVRERSKQLQEPPECLRAELGSPARPQGPACTTQTFGIQALGPTQGKSWLLPVPLDHASMALESPLSIQGEAERSRGLAAFSVLFSFIFFFPFPFTLSSLLSPHHCQENPRPPGSPSLPSPAPRVSLTSCPLAVPLHR